MRGYSDYYTGPKWLYFGNDELPKAENLGNRRSRRDLAFFISPGPLIDALDLKIEVSGLEN